MKKLDMPSYEDAFSYYNDPNKSPMEPSKNTQNNDERAFALFRATRYLARGRPPEGKDSVDWPED
jgi:hypothetical protein